jgi:hypothetical protein
MKPKGSLLHSQVPATCPYPEVLWIVCNMIHFYSEELLAPCPTRKLEDYPFSAVRNFLFNIFATTLHIGMPFLHLQPEDTPCHIDGPAYHGFWRLDFLVRVLAEFVW